jgi:hypothetical protein
MIRPEELRIPREEDESSYLIEQVDDSVIDRFVREHAGDENEKYWVSMGMVREVDGHQLFTFGSGPCADLVFVSSGTKIKLGHLPYMYIDRSKGNLEKTEEEEIIENLLRDQYNTENWTLYLFALAPYDETLDAKQVRDATVKDLITRFTDSGVRCVDKTITSYGTFVSGLIVDPLTRRIQVSYKERSSKRK